MANNQKEQFKPQDRNIDSRAHYVPQEQGKQSVLDGEGVEGVYYR